MLNEKILHHFIHDIKLSTPCFMYDNPVTTLESPVQIFSHLDLNCVEFAAAGRWMMLFFSEVRAFLFHGVFLC